MKWGRWAIAVLFALAAVWFSWMFRYEPFGDDPRYFLDRWTGESVYADGKEVERISLRHDPRGVISEKRELTDAQVFGTKAGDPFADLIPPPPPGFALERKK